MSSSFAQVLDSHFNQPRPKTELNLIKYLKNEFQKSQHLSVLESWSGFPLIAYLATLGITPTAVKADTHALVEYDAETRKVSTQTITGIFDFTYDSVAFRVFRASWFESCCPYAFYHFVFDSADDSVGKKLLQEVYMCLHDVNQEIWVFEGGRWSKSKEMYKTVKMASWDDVVLEETFKENLKRDTKTFFESKDAYESLGITWKRGILLLGPPGNGKTESIKALLHETTVAAPLYVKSFTTRDVSALFVVKWLFTYLTKP